MAPGGGPWGGGGDQGVQLEPWGGGRGLAPRDMGGPRGGAKPREEGSWGVV